MIPCDCVYTERRLLGRFAVLYKRRLGPNGCEAHDDNATTLHLQLGREG